jgi:broad specificity phosphatase PhoE
MKMQNVPLEEFQPPPYETATDLAKRAHRFISHALSHITSELEKRGEWGNHITSELEKRGGGREEKVIKVLIVSHGGLLLQVSDYTWYTSVFCRVSG